MSSKPTPLVLLVEDDEDIRETMSELMEAEGIRVRSARDGAEGLELLRRGLSPQAVFLDKWMPKLDGASVLAAMVEDPALATIPIIWMSGDQQAPPSHASAFLEKPFTLDDAVAVLRALCEAD
ncbi:MAG TPA: response regulator [Anaeromyxobacteraceae bacterium]|nr:response regulator [Anaeromyxobacteraceae bacterium]